MPIKLLTTVLSTLFPDACVSCGTTGSLLCLPCSKRLTVASDFTNPLPKYVTSVFSYKDTSVKKLIWYLKYKNRKELSIFFGRYMFDTLTSQIHDDIRLYSDSYILLPIPLHPTTLRKRGYNQSLVLAQNICSHDTTGVFSLNTTALVRVKLTPSNATSNSKTSRFKNIHGAFSIKDSGSVKDKVCILVDDVFTTGATIDEARKTLIKSGAKNVIAVTIAH